jgi:acetyltransferase-like isoleucine patch superfamily enzyme
VTNCNASYLSDEEVHRMPFKALGAGVLIDRNVSLVNIENVSIGSNTRIDAYSTLIATGHISIGSNVHISTFTYFSGMAGIELRDFSGISSGVRLYSVSDDFSGQTSTNPMIPDRFKKLRFGRLIIGKHAVIGAGTVVLPGVEIGEGCTVGSLSLVKQSTEPWGIYAGIPGRRIRERSRELLARETEFLKK